MSSEFDRRSFFITGGAKGLGRAIALDLLGCGAFVGVMDVDAEGLGELSAAAAGSAARLHVHAGNAGDRTAVEAACSAFALACGGIDGAINNAAYLVYEPLESIAEETLDRMIDAGFKSAIWGSQALLRHRRPGVTANIINFSSPVAYRGYPNAAVYSAIKSATTSLTRTLAAELGPQGIRVNAIAPGSVPTPGALKYVPPAEYARRSATIPMRRLGREQDVVDGVKYLLSDAAGFVNGAVLAVDGGIIAAA